jgi:alanyl-tRNA synthetase
MMDAQTLRRAFLDYYQARGHAIIGGAPLIPEHDPSVLFTTAGMHPLVPFLLGESHPAGVRLANVQRCLRTNDIDEVGDGVHLTFFEMLGAWSLGDYWKREAQRLSFGFLTERLGLDPARIWVTCFAGDADAPRDNEAATFWRELGISERRILFLPKADNWWGPAGASGPCGPDSELFYDTDPTGDPDATPATDPARFWEVGNNVFMQYDLRADGRYHPLGRNNVDLGIGLERTLALVEGVPSAYETELFAPIMDRIRTLAAHPAPFAVRVIADHTRAAVNILAEGIAPGKVDQPYIARRLIRRAIRYGREIGIAGHFLANLAGVVIPTLSGPYPDLAREQARVEAALDDEETRFQRTLAEGEKELAKAVAAAQRDGGTVLRGAAAFRLFTTFGFPVELTQEVAAQAGLDLDRAGFEAAFAEHQALSRQGAAARFRGGLAERIPATTRLHTATHLLQAALRQVLGPHVAQQGSNITAERLRFDFVHGERLTPEQIAAVEALVNAQIGRDLPVSWAEMAPAEARAQGAIGLFEDRYGDQVKVYSIGDFSREICGGPHVGHTGELGRFRIVKEEAVGAGVRRIRAVLDSPADAAAA